MKKYLIVYRGAVQPEDGKQHMNNWMNWVQSIGDAMIDPGTPVYPSKTITSSSITDTQTGNPINGISIIQAEDYETALKLVKPCPHLNIGGSIELAETMDLPMA